MSRGTLWTVVVLAAAGMSLPATGAEPADRILVLPPTPPAAGAAVPLPPPGTDVLVPRGYWPPPFAAQFAAPVDARWFGVIDEEDQDAGWLGLQLAPVPAALASHLGIEDTGLLVNNLFEDGPADKAGLQQYDVIVEVDGEKVSPDVPAFAAHIRGRKSGGEVKLTVYRKSQKQEVAVSLGEMPRDLSDFKLKYEEDPDVARWRSFGIRGRILRPGPDGWILDELDELPDIEHLDRWIERWGDGRPGGAEAQEGRRVTRNGEVLHVRREKDGTIVARRYTQAEGPEAEAKAEAKTYQNMDELREADREAYDLLRSSESARFGDQTLKDYQDAVRQYMDRLLKEHRRVVPTPPSPPTPPGERRERFFRFQPRGVLPRDAERVPSAPADEPEARFEVHPDGSISAEVEDGSTQLKMTFGSEEEFKAESPRLYERYKAVKDRLR